MLRQFVENKHEKPNFLKRRMKKKTKNESQKKMRNHFSRHRKIKNMENKWKKMFNKRRKKTKPSILGTKENRKSEFCRSFTRTQ